MKIARGPKAVWTMLLLPPVTLAVLIVVYAAWAGVTPGDAEAEATIRSALGPILIVNHLALFAGLWVLLRHNGEDLADIGWSAKAVDTTLLREIGIGLVCGLGLYLFKEFAVDSVRALAAGNTPTFHSLFRFRPGSLEFGLTLAATTVVFVEESIYRGYALPYFEKRWGTLMAVLVTSAAFGPLHWGNGLAAIVNAIVMGILFAWIFVWRRSLVAGTVAHALFNFLVLLA
jgi:membrane protease YdiL (CAAX protease family)